MRVDRKVQPNERLKGSGARARQRALGRGLRAHFEEFTGEAIPDDFLSLLGKLDTTTIPLYFPDNLLECDPRR